MDNSLSEIKPMDKNSHPKQYIENGADIEAKNDNGNTPLISASAIGHDIVKFLIENGADIEAKNNDGNTPLIRASVYHGCVEIVKILIENGADTEAKNNAGYDFTSYLTKANKDEINKFIETGCFNFTVKPAKK